MSLIPNFFNRRSNVFDPFSLDVWDPFEGFPPLSSHSNFPSKTLLFAATKVDLKETPNVRMCTKADVSGLKKEEVKVEIEDSRVLQISGERSQEQEEKSDTWHRVKQSSGRFSRRFRLPENMKSRGLTLGPFIFLVRKV